VHSDTSARSWARRVEEHGRYVVVEESGRAAEVAQALDRRD
jgi:uncharacterized protein (DUF2384 family)